MRVSVDSRRRMAEKFLGHPGVGVRVLAERIHLPLTEKTGAAGDREADHYAVAYLQRLDLGPDLDDFTHELMPDDVPLLHRRNETVVKVQVGAADRRGCDPHNRVALVDDLRVWHIHYPQVLFSVPAISLHIIPPNMPTRGRPKISIRIFAPEARRTSRVALFII